MKRKLTFMLLALASLISPAHSAPVDILRVDKSSDVTEASIRDNQIIRFRIRYNCVSTTSDARQATIVDVLDNHFELVGVTTSSHVRDWTVSGQTVSILFKEPLPAGSTGDVFIQVRFKATTPGNTIATNKATFSARDAVTVTSNTVSVKGINPNTNGNGSTVFERKLHISKTASENVRPYDGYIEYFLSHGNLGAVSQNAPNYVIEDVWPLGQRLEYFRPDKFNGTDLPVNVYYQTASSPVWRAWPGNPRFRTGDDEQWVHAYEVSLIAGDYIRGLRFDYGTLPGGGNFHRNNQVRELRILTRIIDPNGPVPGTKIQNCATVSASSFTSVQSCDDTTVQTPQASFNLLVWDSSATGPYEIGETFRMVAALGLNPDSNTDMQHPSIGVLLPPEFEYVGNPEIQGEPWQSAGQPVPRFERVDNFKPNQTLLRWMWEPRFGNGFTIAKNREYRYMYAYFDVKVKNRTPNAWYKTEVYGDWAPKNAGWSWWEVDANDWDRDGNTTENRARNEGYVFVETGSGTAGFESTMWVKGELDSQKTKYPNKGETTAGGRMDYELRIKNPSGVLMRDLVIIDILPHVGDRGVVDLSPRRSEWSPYLSGAVVAPGGTVYYSESKNPCRDELTPGVPAGCEPPNWTTALPSDITRVKSLKIDFGPTLIYPGDEMVINWSMRAPINTPTGGQVAWNSFGYIGTRHDDGTKLFASEPIKTGIAIRPPLPPYYGDFVWNDVNKNGVQDPGEPGINGVRIELYKDNGDGLSNPASDSLEQFTATANDGTNDGAYLFGNLVPGNYYAVVYAPADWGISPHDQGTSDTKDSDGVASIFNGRRVAIMPVTKLDPPEEDRSWDQGLYDRSGVPSVWAVQPQPDGKVLLGGKFATSHGLPRRNIVRTQANGAVDTSFNPGTGFDGEVRSLALLGSKIFVGGYFSTYNGRAANGIALLNPDGTYTVTLPTLDQNAVRWVGSDSNGLYFAGSFNNVGGVPRGNIARLTHSLAVDTTFQSSNGANDVVNCAVLQPDGKIVIGGRFTSYGGVSCNRIARLNINGTLDTSCATGAGANGEVFALKLLEDGRILLTGSFTNFNGVPCNGTMRIMPNGTVDPTISPSALTVDSIQATN